jgi:hypothetical protein
MPVKTMANILPTLGLQHPYATASRRLNWLLLFRVVAIGVTLLTLVLFGLALPHRLADLSAVTITTRTAHMQLNLVEALRLAQMGITPASYALVMVLIEAGLMLAFALVSGIMLWRKGDDRFALFLAVAAITYAAYITPPLDSLLALASPLSWLSRLVQALGFWCAINFYYLFPDGRFAWRWTRNLSVACGLWAILWTVYPIPLLHPVNPFGLTLPGMGLHLFWFVSGLLAQAARYRLMNDPVQRRQTKWVFCAAAVAVLLYALLFTPPLVWPDLYTPGW